MVNIVAPDSWLNSSALRQVISPTSRVRVLLHILFWLVMIPFQVYMHSWTLKGSAMHVYVTIIAADLATISACYYLMARIGLPRLYNNKWISFLLCIIAVYCLSTFSNYYLYRYIAEEYPKLGRLADVFGKTGFLYALFRQDTFLINWSFTLSTLALPVVGKVVKDMVSVRLKTSELERDNLRLELKFLQSQIQPHFVLNSLNSVYSMVAGTDDEAGAMLLRLAELLRYALHEAPKPSVPLSREVGFLREYIALEAVRQHERTTLSFKYDGMLEGYDIPPLILVTFVENAIKHGINATYRQAWADVRLQINEEGVLHFRVENSKPPVEVRHKGVKQPSGIGIENTRRRLNLLFPDKYELVIQDEEETFVVLLTIQLEKSTRTHLTQPKPIHSF